MEKQQRRYKRFNLDFMAVNGRMKFTSGVDILDISLGGISLKTDRRLNIGNEYTLKIDGNGKLLSAKGVVVWASLLECKKSSNGDLVPIYATGMEFKDVSRERIAELVSFIESHAEDRLDIGRVHTQCDPRLHMRFHVNSQGKAVLTHPEDYTIRNISRSGMLIETGDALKVKEELPMEITLPGNNHITFLGRIASSTPLPDMGPKRFAVGIEFLNMTGDAGRQLNTFISMLPQQNITSPLR